MVDKQRNEIGTRFPDLYLKKKIVSFDIPNIYNYGDTQLIEILKNKIIEIQV
ncbi:hypothetical protein K9M79_06050 [Candidatus Woesearchaeota archaeon]|nr:hypothetical protein [Candidatus Woesearchaeota archaeon]